MTDAPKCSFCDQPSIITMAMAGPGAGTLQEIHCCDSDDCREREREAREAFDADCDAQQQDDENHPLSLASCALNNAAQIAKSLPRESTGPYHDDVERIVELLVDAGGHVGALHVLLEARDRTIAGHEERIASLVGEVFRRERILAERDEELRAYIKLRDELIATLEDDKRELLDDGLRQAQTITRLEATDTENKTRLCEAQKKAEDLTRDMAGALTEITELFNRARGIVLYDRKSPRDLIIHEEPRKAAGGRSS